MDTVVSLTAKVAEYTVEPIGRQAGYLLSYKGNFMELEDHLNDLEAARVRMNHSVEVERRNGKEIYTDVVNWLEKVNELIEKANQLQNDPRRAKVGRFTWSLFPNLSLRRGLSRKATKIAKVVVELKGKDPIGYLHHPVFLDGAAFSRKLPFATQGSTSGKLQMHDLVRDVAIEDFQERSEVTLAVSPPSKPLTHSCWHKCIDIHIASDVGRDPPPSTDGRVTCRRRNRGPRRIVDDASIYVSLPTTDNDSSTQASASIQPTHDNPYNPSTCEDDQYVPSTQDNLYIASTYEHGSSSARPTLHCPDDSDDTQSSSQDLNINDDTDSGDDDIPTLRVQGEVDEEVKWLLDGRVVIKPVGNTFLPTTESAHAITYVIRKNFKQPWMTWGEIIKNDADSRMMFDSFRSKCAWLPEHTELVRKNFHHRAARRMSDMLRDVREKGEKPRYIGPNIWSEMLQRWSNEDWKKVSRHGKTDRALTKCGSLHTGGSFNTAQILTRLEKRPGRHVQLQKLLRHMHVPRDSDSDSDSGEEQYIDQQSREVQEKFQLAMDRYHAQQVKQIQDLKAQMEQQMNQMIEQQRQAVEQLMNQMMEQQMRHMMEMMQQQQQWRQSPISQFYQEAAWPTDSQGMGWPSPSQQHGFFLPSPLPGQQYDYRGLPNQQPQTSALPYGLQSSVRLSGSQQMRHMMEMMQQQQWRPSPISQFYQEATWPVDSQGMEWPSPSQQHGFFSPPPVPGQQYYYRGCLASGHRHRHSLTVFSHQSDSAAASATTTYDTTTLPPTVDHAPTGATAKLEHHTRR